MLMSMCHLVGKSAAHCQITNEKVLVISIHRVENRKTVNQPSVASRPLA